MQLASQHVPRDWIMERAYSCKRSPDEFLQSKKWKKTREFDALKGVIIKGPCHLAQPSFAKSRCTHAALRDNLNIGSIPTEVKRFFLYLVWFPDSLY